MQLFHTEMYGRESTAGREILDTAPRKTAHPASAKGVVHLFMNGGPSQMDLFDPKVELDKRHGEDYFKKIAGEVEFPEAASANEVPIQIRSTWRERNVGQ